MTDEVKDVKQTRFKTLRNRYIYIRYILTFPDTHVQSSTVSRKNLQKNSRKI